MSWSKTPNEMAEEIKSLQDDLKACRLTKDYLGKVADGAFKRYKEDGDKIKSLESRLKEAQHELDIARQTHFQREKSLEKRLQLMGEKLKEWQK